MRFNFMGYDSNGIPTHVHTNDGYMQTSREFDIETDGWMLEQLEYSMFPAIAAGEQMRQLVDEVNALRRQVFMQNKRNKI